MVLMFTCFIRYTIDPNKIKEFEEYAHAWIGLIEKYGGTHHGYFLPGQSLDELPNPTFSFPGLGKEGPKNIAVALFSFPSLKAYETYKRDVAEDPKCKAMTARFNETKHFLSYERTFLKPILK
jgi:hypothetical protein